MRNASAFYRCSITIVILMSSLISAISHGYSWGLTNDDLEEYKVKAKAEEYRALLDNPDLCEVLSSAGCAAIAKIPRFKLESQILGENDYGILSDLMSLTPERSKEGMAKIIGEPRKLILRNSGLSLGVQVGIAVESSRYNRLWSKGSKLMDRGVDFRSMLIDDGTGKNILPPVLKALGDSRQIGAGGRVFRVAGQVYRVVEPPKFILEAPTWREYLSLPVPKPSIPPASVLPITEEEVEYWRTSLVRGYVKGVATTNKRVKAKYRRLERDFTGMALYHLMREYNMISEPKISRTHNAVLSTENGSVLALDDSILVLSVEPKLNSIRSNWEAYPQLKKFSAKKDEYLDSVGELF
jgi:defect-in-organelle-trafficking protein DotC